MNFREGKGQFLETHPKLEFDFAQEHSKILGAGGRKREKELGQDLIFTI